MMGQGSGWRAPVTWRQAQGRGYSSSRLENNAKGAIEGFHKFYSAFLALLNQLWYCGDVIDQEFLAYGRKMFVGPLEVDQG